MKVVVFGASGRVGRLVVRDLLQRDLSVVAFVHGHSPFVNNNKLKLIQGDINNSSLVSDVVSGADVVISTLGSWGTKSKNILTVGFQNIIPAMEKHDVKRVISLTGADALLPNESTKGLQVATRPLFKLVAGKILSDGQKHLELLSKSNLDWTVIRSPVMISKESSRFLLNNKVCPPWETISRNAVAQAIVYQLNDSSFVGKAPFVHQN